MQKGRHPRGCQPFLIEPAACLYGSEKTVSTPPSSVNLLSSRYPPTAPRPSVSFSRPAARPMPAQPPIPESTPMYCLPLNSHVFRLPMMPEGVLNLYSSFEMSLASTHFTKPSSVP